MRLIDAHKIESILTYAEFDRDKKAQWLENDLVCKNCLCRSCLNVCCDRKSCVGKRTECERYAGFVQLRLNPSIPQPNQYNKSPREPLSYYGISKNRKKNLKQLAKSGRYKDLVRKCAYETDKDIAEYIIKHVEKGKSWDVMEMDLELGRICVGRSNFYGYVRKFYDLLNKEFRRIGI